MISFTQQSAFWLGFLLCSAIPAATAQAVETDVCGFGSEREQCTGKKDCDTTCQLNICRYVADKTLASRKTSSCHTYRYSTEIISFL